MKAWVCHTPGELRYREEAIPSKQAGNTLLRIRRMGVCGTDLHAYEGTQPFFSYPRVLGHELAAEIVDTDVPDFAVGEAVTFIPYFYCGQCIACRQEKSNCCEAIQVCGVHIDGGMREYLSVPSYALVKNQGLGLDELALAEPLAIGAHAVRRAAIHQDEFVLVIGAGPIGLGIMEFARIAGGRVIAMDINAQRLQFCKDALGISHTVLATGNDVEEQLRKITNRDMPTVVIDATGSLRAINQGFHYMAHGGRYVLVGLQREAISFSHPEFHKREGTLMSSRNATRQDFDHVLNSIKQKLLNPSTYITHRVEFDAVDNHFASWLNPATGVIKAMIHL